MRKKYFLIVGLSFEAVILISLSVYWGAKLDIYLKSGFKAVLSLIILSLIIWFYQIIKLLK